jgi:hypothetical protein
MNGVPNSSAASRQPSHARTIVPSVDGRLQLPGGGAD